MNYSFMSFSCPGLDLPGCLDLAKAYGYDGFEPRIDAGHKHGIEIGASKDDLKEARERSAAAGVKLCCVATSCRFSDPASTDEETRHALYAIELAHAVGAPAIRVFGGPIPQGVSREEAVALVVRAFKRVSRAAKDAGVTVCMETHDSWCDPKDVLRVIEAVSHPNIKVNFDIMHPVLTAGYRMEDTFNLLKGHIRHVHVHDGIRDQSGALTLLPIGEGAVDHKTAIGLLYGIGYTGYISGEWIDWQPYEIHLPRELGAMKAYEKSFANG